VEISTKLTCRAYELAQLFMKIWQRDGGCFVHALYTQSEDRQALAKVIVELGRHPAALLLLGIDQHTAELHLPITGNLELLSAVLEVGHQSGETKDNRQ
jgi:hypothetical protein